MPLPSSSLAHSLQSLRLARGWNMDHVAEAAGVSRTTLFHLERGEIRRPRASTLHKLAQLFDVPVEQLLAPAQPASGEASKFRSEISNLKSQISDFKLEISDDERQARGKPASPLPGLAARQAFDRATNPIVAEFAGEHPELFADWSADDWDELYSQFATGGALREEGVRATAERINHDKETLYRLRVVLQTHLADVAAGMVDTLFKLVSVEPEGEERGQGPGAGGQGPGAGSQGARDEGRGTR